MRLKQYINALFACGLLAMTAVACVNDDVRITADNGQEALPEGAITFKIGGISTGAVQSRGMGDPVIASDMENWVAAMNIFVFTSATNSDNDADYVYHSYWTGERRAGGTNVDDIAKRFGFLVYKNLAIATIALPQMEGYAKFLFLTSQPRLFKMDATGENATELLNVYDKKDPQGTYSHIFDNHSFEGMTLADVKALQLVRAKATTNVPVSKLNYTLNLASSYFDIDSRVYENGALDMTAISTNAVKMGQTKSQGMDVTLYRNVVRLDVNNADQLDITDLKIVNVPATTGLETGTPHMAMLGGTPASTYSLMKEVDGVLTCQGTRYCYPANNDAGNELKLQVTIGTSATPIELPLQTVDGDKVSLLRNHRYIVNLRKSADNYVDANVVVADWNVGDNVSVDMESGQSTSEPTISLIAGTENMNSNHALAFWQGTTRVTTRMHDNYIFGGGREDNNPGYYPWLRFDMPRIGSLGIKLYDYYGENNYLKEASRVFLSDVHNMIESEDGKTVRHELVAIPLNQECAYWLMFQNHFAPEKRRMVKVEIANVFYSVYGICTPSLMRFAETNVATNGTLIAFPEGGFGNPYGLDNIPAGDALRGRSATTHTLPSEYALPARDYIRNITPDYLEVGTFARYDGVNVHSATQPDGTVVYYSGSKLDKSVIKLVVNTYAKGPRAGTKYVSGTKWQYVTTPQGDYLEMIQIIAFDKNAIYRNYSEMHALFELSAMRVDVSVQLVKRCFPAAAAGDTYYLGSDGCAMKFNATGVEFVDAYAGAGYVRPVQTHLSWDEPKPVILQSDTKLTTGGGWSVSEGDDVEIGVGGI